MAIILLPNCTMLYYVFSGPLSLRAYVPEIKFNNNNNIPFVTHGSRCWRFNGFYRTSLIKSICIYFHKSVISIVGTIGQKYRRVVCIRSNIIKHRNIICFHLPYLRVFL